MSLHNEIMNIPTGKLSTYDFINGHTADAYAFGHRDARHAAAELSLKYNKVYVLVGVDTNNSQVLVVFQTKEEAESFKECYDEDSFAFFSISEWEL